MSAKDELFNRLKFLDHASSLTVLVDDGIALTEHNGSANLLRKGLGIVAFNILEDFIKNKVLETLSLISNSGIAFNLLPTKLQEASTIGALKALSFRLNIERKEGGNWQSLVHEETLKIHSTKSNQYELSKFSFLSESSNISASDVTDMMKAFGISGGWQTLKAISNAINGGITDLSQSYNNAAERRHNAAHAANYRYESSWLSDLKSEIIAIAASLDIALSAKCRLIANNLSTPLIEHDFPAALSYRFLVCEGSVYKERASLSSRSNKNWSDLDLAKATLKPNLSSRGEFLIILDRRQRIEDWICT